MRIEELREAVRLTAAEVEKRLELMEVRQSATGKLHLSPDFRSGFDPSISKLTFCGLREDRLEPAESYQRPARDWTESALVPPNRRCERCRYGWQTRDTPNKGGC
jgi:hypothetical protein